MYYKMFVPIIFQFGQYLDSKLTYLLNYCRFCDFDPYRGKFLAILRYFSLFESKTKFGIHIVLKIYYKTCVPICFKVWPLFRFQIVIFVELLSILWIWPLSGTFFSKFCVIFHHLTLNKSNLTCIDRSKYIIKCLYQLVFRFGQFLDSKLTYLLNYYRICDFDPTRDNFCHLHNFSLFEAK